MLSLGMDIGTSTVKLVLLRDGAMAEQWMAVHHGRPFACLKKGLSALELDADTPFSLCVTGSNTEALLEQDSAIPSLGDIPAIVEGVRQIVPQAGSVIEIGSQGARFITDLQSRAPQFAVNEHCAGGTGSFFEDQMSRVGCKLEDYSSLVEQAQSIQIGTNGMTLGEYREGDQVLPILLKDKTIDSFRINDLRTLPVFGTARETTTLEQVVSRFDFQYKFSNVKDYNRQMVMMAQADPRRGVNAIAAFNRIWKQVQKEIEVPEGYTMKYFGEQESQAESNAALAANLPLTFFLMFVTLLFLFRSYRKPIVILLMLPLIFIGIVLGLVVLGKSFDFFSILGLLGLIGMNIKNAIVLVDQIDTETAAGKAPREAVISATTTRIVPVAMASGTTILGMLPLLFDAMFGGMAATIMGGLLVASALTLFVLPVAYCAIHKIK